MAQAEKSTSRVGQALRELDLQLEHLRGTLGQQVKQVQQRVERSRELIEGRLRETPLYQRARWAREQIDAQRRQIEQQVRESAIYQRAAQARKQLEDRLEERRSRILDRLGLASKGEIARASRQLSEARRDISQTRGLLSSIDQKLDTLSKKVNELARGADAHR
jgi:chromosome segregation ATPase